MRQARTGLAAMAAATLGVTAKSMPYVHSCTVAFSPACREFLEECQAISRDCEGRGDERL